MKVDQCNWLLSLLERKALLTTEHMKSILFLLCDITAEIECRASCLTVTERYWWQDFRSQKHGSFSCIHCWFNIWVKVGVISANAWFSCVRAMNAECPGRQFTPLKFDSSCGCGQYWHPHPVLHFYWLIFGNSLRITSVGFIWFVIQNCKQCRKDHLPFFLSYFHSPLRFVR